MRRYLLLTAATLLAYGAALFGSFHFDDYSIFNNPAVTSTNGLAQVGNLLNTRPLTNLTFWLNFQIGGSHPLGFHAVNISLHLATVLLLFSTLHRLMPQWAAFWGAALFAVHPIQSEAVAYIFARSTLLSTFFCVASLHLWAKDRRGWAVFLFACAVLSKEECLAFPFILALLSSQQGERSKSYLLPVSCMLGFAALAGARSLWATAHIAGSGAGFTAGISPFAYLMAQGSAILRYLRLLVIPWGLTVEPNVALATHSLYLAAWTIVLAIVGVAIWALRKHRPWAAWVLAGFILLIPSSTAFPAADLAADHRMYLPMVSFAAAFGLLTQNIWRPLLLGILTVFCFLSLARTTVWRTERSLWQEAVRRSPGHVRPLLQLSRVVQDSTALELLAEAKSIEPNNPAISAELGRLWLKIGRSDLALQEFGRSLALRPNDANALNNRGAALLALRQRQAALQDFQHASQLDPCLAAARRNLEALGAAPLVPCPSRER